MQMNWIDHCRANDGHRIPFRKSFALAEVMFELATKLLTDCCCRSNGDDADAGAAADAVGDADGCVKYLSYAVPFGPNRAVQDGASTAAAPVALSSVASLDYADFEHSPLGRGRMLYAIHLNGEYLNGPTANGFALHSIRAQCLSNVSNYFGLKHFALYFVRMMCVPASMLSQNQLSDRCDGVMNDGVGRLTANPEH